MTVQELHITIDLFLQEINSNVYGNVLPEEKDLILNQEVHEFVDSVIDVRRNETQEGFEDNVRRLDDLKEIKQTVDITLSKVSDDLSVAYLPNDYYHYDSSATILLNNCQNLTLATNQVESKIITIPIKTAAVAAFTAINPGYLYKLFEININSVSVFQLSDYYPNGLPTIEEAYLLIPLIIERLGAAGYNVSVDNYGLGAAATFRIIGDATLIDADIIYDSGGVGTLNHTITAVSFETLTQVDFGTNTLKKYPNRLVSTEDIFELNRHSFGKSIYTSPIVEIVKNQIFVHHNKSFIPKALTLNYIREPKRINIYLNQNVEFSKRVLIIIARKTAEKLALIKGAATVNNIIKTNQFLK